MSEYQNVYCAFCNMPGEPVRSDPVAKILIPTPNSKNPREYEAAKRAGGITFPVYGKHFKAVFGDRGQLPPFRADLAWDEIICPLARHRVMKDDRNIRVKGGNYEVAKGEFMEDGSEKIEHHVELENKIGRGK